mgnify:FL=1
MLSAFARDYSSSRHEGSLSLQESMGKCSKPGKEGALVTHFAGQGEDRLQAVVVRCGDDGANMSCWQLPTACMQLLLLTFSYGS